jgi:hypothetical protein
MWEDGVIETDEGIRLVWPGMVLGRLEDLPAPWRNADGGAHQNGKLVSGPVLIRGKKWILGAYFPKGIIGLVVLEVAPEEVRGESRCLRDGSRLLDLYISVIESQTGKKPPVLYAWGLIKATKDPWTLDPSIRFDYRGEIEGSGEGKRRGERVHR